ncbi:MAG TPA: hypothetical protein VL220_05115 [Steroidobacteraceae bacterium]|nr:hypothetical protein [Steroidobacteraceae bacterium]
MTPSVRKGQETETIALAGFSVAVLLELGVLGDTPSAVTLAALANVILVAVGIIILTYAVLRHRVIDVGFVISRTLVFAVFTGLLLVLFAVVEWLVDHFYISGSGKAVF